ncbi:MAG TPA: hypothetical protein VMO26_11325 [Vicinamibacterales bacterium]|nr:hypothetical protein [Vicinamibacterales bacterium]
MRILKTSIAVAMLLICGAAALAEAQDARLTPDRQRDFLLTAKVVNSRPIGRGITGSLRLTLSDGTLTHDAAFQTIDDRTSEAGRRRGERRAGELNFVDSYKYNIAAYEISRLLGVDDMMPVTVERRWRGQTGSLTWWVDDVLMDEAARETSPLQPPRPLDFQRQRMKMLVFAELVGDVDRNKGNVLYTSGWRVVMIDFTRAFRLHRELRQPETLTTIERALWQRLQGLTRDTLRRVTDRHLTLEETGGVMRRHARLIEHYIRLISIRGEGVVLY